MTDGNEAPLLRTKLHIPPLRPDLVRRERLVQRLNEGLCQRHRLTLISAAPGFGKTTLVSDWLSEYQGAAAWLSLDHEDNQATRFWTYLIAALQTVCPELGQDALDLLQSTQPPPARVLLGSLLNDLASVCEAEPELEIILVLDDYHLISAPPIHEGVAFLLEHQPHNLRLVISTRADPPLPIFRLRARGQLSELRTGDLRFTPDESAAFLNSVMGLELGPADVGALGARTEGWIAGLQLAALSLQGREDAAQFIAAFGGSHHFVLEYLTEEVVRRQSGPVRRFLLQTSILDRLCGSLCDALTGESDGAAVLADLQRRNLFIVPLDDERRWYRYHHLFADLLGNLRRQECSPEETRALHLRASVWYQQNGVTAGAVTHALAAQDYEHTAQLIEDNSLAMVTRGELTTLVHWIDALPEAVAQSRPWLCIHQAWPLALAGRPAAAESLLHVVEDQVPVKDVSLQGREILGHVAAMRALMSMMRGEMSPAVELARRADELLPADNLLPRNTIASTLASAHFSEGELAETEQALNEAFRLGKASSNLWTMIRALCDLAQLYMVQGRLRRAEELCHRALREAEERRARKFGTVGFALVRLGEVFYERYDLPAAHDHVREGVKLMQGWQQPYEMVTGYIALATILQAKKDANGAREALRNAEEILAQHPDYRRIYSMVHCGQILVGLAQDGPEATLRLVRQIQFGERGAPIAVEQERIVLARVLLALERWAEASALLTELAEQSSSGKRSGRLIEIRALQAVAREAQGDTSGALLLLEESLALAEPEGYVRAFVELGQPLSGLLRQAAARGTAPRYASQLLVESGNGALPTPVSSQHTPDLIESLTQRELEVLRLLGQGCSNQDIAVALVITLNGVKKHTSNIYGKLAVHSRTQAVVRAQELGLL